jgi:hypothetical protein
MSSHKLALLTFGPLTLSPTVKTPIFSQSVHPKAVFLVVCDPSMNEL